MTRLAIQIAMASVESSSVPPMADTTVSVAFPSLDLKRGMDNFCAPSPEYGCRESHEVACPVQQPLPQQPEPTGGPHCQTEQYASKQQFARHSSAVVA